MRGVVALARGRVAGDATGRRLLLDTAGTIALNLGAVALNVGLVILLSHALGTAGYGAYASAIAWGTLLAALAGMGLTPLVVRTVATYRAGRAWSLLRGVIHRANHVVTVASALTVLAGAVVGWAIYHSRPGLLHPFWIALSLVPLIALTGLRQAAMQGLGRVLMGRTPETVVAPVLGIAFIAATWALAKDRLDATAAAALYAFALLVAFALGVALLHRSLPREVHAAHPEYDMASWRRSGLPLVALNVVLAANTQMGTILVGVFGSAAGAGVFSVATKVTSFISFTMIAAGYPLMPMAARLYSEDAHEALQALVTRAVRMVLVVALPTGLALVLFAPYVLGLFGEGFTTGDTVVRILAIGELVNVLTGFGGLVLVMTGHEGQLTRGVTLGATTNLVLAFALIPMFGATGAAIAAASGTVLANVVLALYAWRRIRIWTPVIPAHAPRLP
jgi:O-antigen/teichoic acid export membrane protein